MQMQLHMQKQPILEWRGRYHITWYKPDTHEQASVNIAYDYLRRSDVYRYEKTWDNGKLVIQGTKGWGPTHNYIEWTRRSEDHDGALWSWNSGTRPGEPNCIEINYPGWPRIHIVDGGGVMYNRTPKVFWPLRWWILWKTRKRRRVTAKVLLDWTSLPPVLLQFIPL